MGSFIHNQGGEPNHEINMTPLIDVSLVLVVMLMLASPLAFESSIDVRGGAGAGQKAKQEEKAARIELAIVSTDSVRVNRTVVSRADLGPALSPLLEQSETRGVTLSCNPSVSHGVFVDVLDRARLSGVIDIAVVER